MGTVLAALDFPGATDELKGCYADKALLRVVEISPPRPVIHLAVPRDYGFRVCDAWNSEEALRPFEQNPEFRKALSEWRPPRADGAGLRNTQSRLAGVGYADLSVSGRGGQSWR